MTEYADLVERLRFLHEKTDFAAFAEAADAIDELVDNVRAAQGTADRFFNTLVATKEENDKMREEIIRLRLPST